MKTWLLKLEANDWLYFFGLGLLFGGLAASVSVATGLIATGAILITQSTVKAYFVTWLSMQPRKK